MESAAAAVYINPGTPNAVSFSKGEDKYYAANADGSLRDIGQPPADLAYCVVRSDRLLLEMAKRASEPSTGGATDIKRVEDDLLEGAKELAEEQHKGAGYIFYVPPGCSVDFIKDVQSLLGDHASVFYRHLPWIIAKV